MSSLCRHSMELILFRRAYRELVRHFIAGWQYKCRSINEVLSDHTLRFLSNQSDSLYQLCQRVYAVELENLSEHVSLELPELVHEPVVDDYASLFFTIR